jgi:hypothetical protein
LTHNLRKHTLLIVYVTSALCAGALATSWGLRSVSEAGALVACTLGVTAAGGGALIAVLLYFLGIRPADRDLAAFQRGDYLVHWSYEPEEWARFARAEEADSREEVWLAPLVLFIVGALLGLLIWPGGAGERALLAFVCGAVLGLYGWGLALLRGYFRRRFLRFGRTRRPEVYIGPRAVYFNGQYTPWGNVATSRVGARLLAGSPPILEFTLFSTRYSHEIRVPVPAGKEQEAEALVALFRNGSRREGR